MADIHFVQDGYGYRDIDVYVKDGAAEWLFRIYKDLGSGEIVRCEARFAETDKHQFSDEGAKAVPAHVIAEMEKVFEQVVGMLNDPTIKVRFTNDSGSETVEFKSSEVLAHNGETREWDELAKDSQHQHLQTSLAEDYALWTFKRKFGDQREYRVDVI